jgi:hypothetical protein
MCHSNLTGAQAPNLEDEMKRSLKNVQLKLPNYAFELLRTYKDIGGFLNLSEAVEKLAVSHLPMEEPSVEATKPKTELSIEDDVPVPESKKPIVSATDKTFSTGAVLQVEDDVPIPQICRTSAESFSHVVDNTLKKMKVGSSFLIHGENQRSISLGVAKKLKITIATRQTESFQKDKTIRVWRVA